MTKPKHFFMKNKYILSLDQGTTSSRAIIYDKNGEVKSVAQKEFTQYFPEPGFVEHDPLEIYTSQISVAAEAIANMGIHDQNIAAIGITNQRETTIVWDKESGKPIYNAIVWQDRRTADYCDRLKKEGYGQLIKEKTGLEIDAYFSATKIRWILDNVAGAQKMAENGKLAFGTVDSWLIWNLTKGKHHLTDVSNASRTMLFNINSLAWDDELLKIFNIPVNMLPEVKSNSELYGYTDTLIFSTKIPITGVAGDQQASMFGQMCVKKGMVKNTYGTGCFIMLNTGEEPVFSKHKLLTTVAWKLKGRTIYALEGSVFIGGAVIQWLRDGINFFRTAKSSEKLALEVESNGGVVFVPAFTGLGAPYWNQNAKGLIYGITRGTTKAHITRAALESIALQSYDVIKAMEKDAGFTMENLRVDGGAAANNLLMQIQADVLQTKVQRPANLESTALGAAFFAGLASEYWQSIDDIADFWKIDREFLPETKEEKVESLIKQWHTAIGMIQEH
jgi:glycerol kinase